MRILLINDNPAVSRLVKLSVEKLGFSIDEVNSFEEVLADDYNIVFIDSEQYDDDKANSLKQSGLSAHIVYLASKGQDKPSASDSIISKPFLPTDLTDLMNRIGNESTSAFPIDMEEKEEEIENISLDIPKIEQESLYTDTLEDKEEDKIELDSFGLDDDTVEEGIDDLDMLDMDDLGIDEEILAKSEDENNSASNEEDEDLEMASILDSEEIDEVKQLLKEEEEEEFTLELPEETAEENLVEQPEEDLDLDTLDEKELMEELDEELQLDTLDENEESSTDLEIEDEQEDDLDLSMVGFELPDDAEKEESEDELDFDALDTPKEESVAEEEEEEFTLELPEETAEENLVEQPEEDLDLDTLDEKELMEELDEELQLDTLDENEESSTDLEIEDEQEDDLDLNIKEDEENEDEDAVSLDVGDLEDELNSIEVEEVDLAIHDKEESLEPLEGEEVFENVSMEELETKLDTLIEETEEIDDKICEDGSFCSQIDSLDDLHEKDILKALGEEVEEDFIEEIEDEQKEESIEDISDEIESLIGESVKEGLLNSKFKDSLKGLKVNISISFDEK